MTGQWTAMCKVKDIPVLGSCVLQRGIAWQELPGVALFRTADDQVYAVLDRWPDGNGALANARVEGLRLVCPCSQRSMALTSGGTNDGSFGKTYDVKLDRGKVYLDLSALGAPASRAEAALAGSFAVAAHVGIA
jgi:nitrite reductase (NADH) small subunit